MVIMSLLGPLSDRPLTNEHKTRFNVTLDRSHVYREPRMNGQFAHGTPMNRVVDEHSLEKVQS
jgi:hypothetical protein